MIGTEHSLFLYRPLGPNPALEQETVPGCSIRNEVTLCHKKLYPQVWQLSTSRTACVSTMPSGERSVLFQKSPDLPEKHSTQYFLYVSPKSKMWDAAH